LKFVRAESIPLHNTKLIRSGVFYCINKEWIEIPEYVEKHVLGRYKKTISIIHAAKRIKTHDFMKFLGLYLAEGFCSKYIITIAQSPNGQRRKEIESILNNLGFRYRIQKNGFYQIHSIQFCNFMNLLGLKGVKAGKKFIPAEFKEFAPSYLESLIYGFALGDGNWHKRTGQLTLTTSSKKLADDLQELIIKCGKLANIRIQKAKGTIFIEGYLRKNDIYVLSLRTKKIDYYLDNRVIGEQYYNGKIWDVEVEDWHTLLVRRNGKPFFSGNCRFGYPTISIQIDGVLNGWGDFLYSCANTLL
jgi:intein/homing endonuclease